MRGAHRFGFEAAAEVHGVDEAAGAEHAAERAAGEAEDRRPAPITIQGSSRNSSLRETLPRNRSSEPAAAMKSSSERSGTTFATGITCASTGAAMSAVPKAAMANTA
ncbi:MAG: hypothetical protein ACT4P4_01795 [Betaproteobacteria bacterium]